MSQKGTPAITEASQLYYEVMRSSGKENPNSVDFLKYALNHSDEKLANSLNKIDFEKPQDEILKQFKETYFNKSEKYAAITKDVVRELREAFKTPNTPNSNSKKPDRNRKHIPQKLH